MAGLARQHDSHRLHVNDRLAPEGAADFGCMHAQVARLHAEQPGDESSYDEVALAGNPELRLSVGVGARERRVGLDVALVYGRCLEAQLDDLVSGGEARSEVTHLVFDALRDIRRL